MFGVEGDIGGANIHGARTCGASVGRAPVTFTPSLFSPFALTCGEKMDWLATATARVGYAYGRTLYYVKGGGAWTNETTVIGCVIAPQNNVAGAFNTLCRNQALAVTNGFSTSGDRFGWTLGFGTEFAFNNNWSAKGEFDYIDFGRRTGTASDGTTVLSTKTNLAVTKIGVNYKFAAFGGR